MNWRGCLASLLLVPAAAATPHVALEELFKQADASDLPGLYLRLESPLGIQEFQAGAADPDSGRRFAAEAPFRIASITKLFVNALVLREVASGRLQLDAPLQRHLDAAEYGVRRSKPDLQAITLHHLLEHSSGLWDFRSDSMTFGLAQSLFDPRKQWSQRELIGDVLRHRPYFAPGAEYRYSNANALLLSAVLEKLHGVPIETLLQQQASALGLKAWAYEREPRTPPDLPRGFTGKPARPKETTDWSMGGLPDAALQASASDLARFIRALFEDDTLLPAHTRALWLEQEGRVGDGPQRALPGIQLFAGAGLIRTYWYNGKAFGYKSWVAYQPELERSAVLFMTSTREGDERWFNQVLGKVVRDARAQPSNPP
ncbi:MAG: beta-lactamase family protein [Xanthomonadales bacterium]|nr:beta-lactamase family protein [Xanthomonadales bacterium]MCC6562525.1 beta-lactamase family protein [Xanthomonadales bacterium]